MRWRGRFFLFLLFTVISLWREHAHIHNPRYTCRCITYPNAKIEIAFLAKCGFRVFGKFYSIYFFPSGCMQNKMAISLYRDIITILLSIGNTTVKYYLLNLKNRNIKYILSGSSMCSICKLQFIHYVHMSAVHKHTHAHKQTHDRVISVCKVCKKIDDDLFVPLSKFTTKVCLFTN